MIYTGLLVEGMAGGREREEASGEMAGRSREGAKRETRDGRYLKFARGETVSGSALLFSLALSHFSALVQ